MHVAEFYPVPHLHELIPVSRDFGAQPFRDEREQCNADNGNRLPKVARANSGARDNWRGQLSNDGRQR